MLLKHLLARLAHLHSYELEPSCFEFLNDLGHHSSLDSIWFDHDVGSLFVGNKWLERNRISLVVLDGEVALEHIRMHTALLLELHNGILHFHSVQELENFRFLVQSSVLFLLLFMGFRGQLKIKSFSLI